ncbi:MAG: hypothetical protein PHF39_02855 [Methanoregula sp.]|nr:hypothetical protein [Methanoregula sp.]
MIGIAGDADKQFVTGAPVLFPYYRDDLSDFADELPAVFRCDEAFGITKDNGISPV